MGNAGRNGGEYYTPRPLIRAMVRVVNPKIGETIYDGAVGSAGFLCESYDYLCPQAKRAADLKTLQEKTFYGMEKKSLAYVIAIMNMILHGIETPNIVYTNTLSFNLADVQNKDRYDVILAKTPQKTESGLRLITAKNVKMGYVQVEPREFVAPDSYDGWMTRGIPKFGDVLFTTEAPLANVAQLDTDEKVVFAQRIIIMQPDASRLDSTFLKYLLLSQPVQQRIIAKGTGATVQGIKASLLKLIEISFPKSISEQQ